MAYFSSPSAFLRNNSILIVTKADKGNISVLYIDKIHTNKKLMKCSATKTYTM